MGTNEILQEIKKLPLRKQILILEKTLRTIREQEFSVKMKNAADTLHSNYMMDADLTEFTVLDSEQFYEVR